MDQLTINTKCVCAHVSRHAVVGHRASVYARVFKPNRIDGKLWEIFTVVVNDGRVGRDISAVPLPLRLVCNVITAKDEWFVFRRYNTKLGSKML